MALRVLRAYSVLDAVNKRYLDALDALEFSFLYSLNPR